MSKKVNSAQPGIFERFAAVITRTTGSTPAFIIAFVLVLAWGATGPIFHYSETWQLVINTGTTIITFLMVFLIQKTQNKDSLAIQLKLNELIAQTEESLQKSHSIDEAQRSSEFKKDLKNTRIKHMGQRSPDHEQTSPL